jgi:predicted MFS family arabinose efflux permease
VYGSHQYYGVSGGVKRSGLMAIHETIIGAGFAAGSLVGGMLSDAFGRHSPYWFACAVIVAAGLIQIILWFSIRKED